MGYQVECSRVYGADELYSTGSGLSAFEPDLAAAQALFDRLCADTSYRRSVELTDCESGKVLRHFGPSMADATRSMNAAYRRRRATVSA